jgi:hypothetical protein
MEIELIKKSERTGEVWYHIVVDGSYKYSRMDETEANELYNKVVANAMVGIEKTETIRSIEL